MIKVRIEYECGKYHATLLSDEEVADNEKCGYCVVSIPESKAIEWGEMQSKMEEWHKYWNSLSNEWYDNEDRKWNAK